MFRMSDSRQDMLRKMVAAVELRPRDAMKVFDTGLELSADLEIRPEEFLNQAEEDLERGGDAARLNAITNAKRAIHCQIDSNLIWLGYKPARWSIRRKVEVFSSLGVVAPRILERVTEARNLVEHAYQAPTDQQVVDAVDLALLFTEAAS